MQTFDAVIVGGGLSGLTAAVILAKEGIKVALLEKGDQLGGRAMTLNKGGAMFNLGAHALYKHGEAYSTFRDMGLKLEGGEPAAGRGLCMWNGTLSRLPANAVQLIGSRLLSWSGKIELGRFMLNLARIDTEALKDVTLRQWAEAEIRDPMFRHLMYALARLWTYAHEPNRQSAGYVLKQGQMAMEGNVVYMNGGWGQLVRQLHDRAVRAGVTVLNRRLVAGIERTESGMIVACSGEEPVAAHSVLLTTSPTDAYKLVQGAEHTALKQWKDEAAPVLAACLDLALRKLPRPDRAFAIGLDEPVYFSNHSNVARLSENGTIVLHLLRYLGTEPVEPQAAEKQLERVMDAIQPGWRQEVAARQFMPRMTVANDFARTDRPTTAIGPDVPGMPGIYVAGDWTGRGEMLADASVAGAKRAAARMAVDMTKARAERADLKGVGAHEYRSNVHCV